MMRLPTPASLLWRARHVSIAIGATCVLGGLTPAAAQEGLFPARTATVSPIFERWSFASGLRQPSSDGGTTVELKTATAWSIPISASVALGERWTVDVSAAYSNGTVQLRAPDPALGRDDYALSGMTDVRTRLTGHIVGDNVIVTLGANLPSGTTSLDPEQFAALRVLASPALGMQTPALGTGFGATAGVVLARQIAAWAWAFGASYELRRSYNPVSFATGTPAPDMDPGDALHLSVGADGLVGQSGMTLAVSADLFTDDKLQTIVGTGSSQVASQAVTTHLGPIFTVDWQLRIASTQLRELTLYAVDRYRTPYERGGTRVEESSGNYLDAGIRTVFPLSPSTGLSSVLNLRHQTGLKSDSTLATAATAGAGVTIGIVRAFSGYSLQPFVRADYAKIKSVDASATGTGLAAGITLGRRF
jgi:hypothetical protein